MYATKKRNRRYGTVERRNESLYLSPLAVARLRDFQVAQGGCKTFSGVDTSEDGLQELVFERVYLMNRAERPSGRMRTSQCRRYAGQSRKNW